MLRCFILCVLIRFLTESDKQAFVWYLCGVNGETDRWKYYPSQQRNAIFIINYRWNVDKRWNVSAAIYPRRRRKIIGCIHPQIWVFQHGYDVNPQDKCHCLSSISSSCSTVFGARTALVWRSRVTFACDAWNKPQTVQAVAVAVYLLPCCKTENSVPVRLMAVRRSMDISSSSM